MVHLWIVYCRSILEQSCVIWHSSLTKQNTIDLERTQKVFTKFLLQDKYVTYEDSLLKLNLTRLSDPRKYLNLKFSKRGIKENTLNDLVPLNNKQHRMKTRQCNKYFVDKANTERRRKFSVIFMQNELNREDKENQLPIKRKLP